MVKRFMPPERARDYWRLTMRLMWSVLALWFLFGFAIHLFVADLNRIVVFGFPLGFYMAAQGSLVAFVIVIFWYARRQNRIDEDYGVSED